MKRAEEQETCKEKKKSHKKNPLYERIYDEFTQGSLTFDLFSEVMTAESLTSSDLNVKIVEHAVAVGCDRIADLVGVLSDMAGKLVGRLKELQDGALEMDKQVTMFMARHFLIFESTDIPDSTFKKITKQGKSIHGAYEQMATHMVEIKKVLSDKLQRKYATFLEFMAKQQPLGDYFALSNRRMLCGQCDETFCLSYLKSDKKGKTPNVCVKCLKEFQAKSQTLEDIHFQLAKLDFNSRALTQ